MPNNNDALKAFVNQQQTQPSADAQRYDLHNLVLDENKQPGTFTDEQLIKVLKAANVEILGTKDSKDGKLYFVQCPNKDSHTTETSISSTAVYCYNGYPVFKCQHSHCTNLKFSDYAAAVGLTYQKTSAKTEILPDGTAVHTVAGANNGKSENKEAKQSENVLTVRRLSDVKIKNIQFVFFPWFPRGKITIVQGDSSSGKSTFMYAVGGAVTVNNSILTVPCEDAGGVLFLTVEDDASEIATAVMDAGGDGDKAFSGNPEEIAGLDLSPEGVDLLSRTVRENHIVMIVLDPLQAFLTGDINKSTETRPQLARLAAMAEELNISVVIIQHTGKDQSKKALHKGIGSVDIGAASRSLLQIVTDPENDDYRIMFTVKNNLADIREVRKGIRYRIADSPLASVSSGTRMHYRGHAEFVDLIPNYSEKTYNNALRNSEQGALEASIDLETDPLALTVVDLVRYNPNGCFLRYDDLIERITSARGYCPYTRDKDKTTGINNVIRKIRDPMFDKYKIQIDVTESKLTTKYQWQGEIITSNARDRGLKVTPINQVIDGKQTMIIEGW